VCRLIHSDFKSRLKWLESRPSFAPLPTVENVQKTVTLPLAVSFPARCVFFLLSHFWGSLQSSFGNNRLCTVVREARTISSLNADPARALYLSVSLSVCRRQAPSSRENLLKLTGWTVAAASSPTFSAMSNCPRSRILGRGRYIDENTSPRWMVSRWPNRPGARGNDLFLPEGDTANFECKSSSQS